MTHSLRNISVFLWLAAFVCALYPVNDWQLWLFAVAITLSYVWAFAVLAAKLKDGWPVPKSSVLYAAGAFWLWAAFSVFWSDIKPVTLMALSMFSVMPLGFFAGVFACDEAFFKKLAPWIAGIFAVLSAWAVFQFFFLNAYFMGQARHPLADPSSLGALLLMGFFCALGWLLAADTKKQRIWAALLSILILCGVLSTVARAPVFAGVPVFVVLVAMLFQTLRQKAGWLVLVFAAGFAFYGLMQTDASKQIDLGQRLFGGTQFMEQQSNAERIAIWKSSLRMVEDRPVLGTGLGTFFLYYPEYRDTTQDTNGAILAHNDPLQYAVELGIPGMVLFYAFVVLCAWRGFVSPKRLDGKKRIVAVSLFCALAALVATSHVGFSLYNLSILMMTGMILGAWFNITADGMNDKVTLSMMPANVPPAVNKALLALPFVMTIWLLFGITAGEYYANRAARDLFREDMLTFADDINKSARVSQGMNGRAYLLAVNVPMSILEFEKGRMKDDKQKELYAQVTDYMTRVLAINPREASAYYYLGKVQTLVTSSLIPEGTMIPEDYYKQALALDPKHLGARMALYDLYRRMKKPLADQLAVMEPGEGLLYNTPAAMGYYQKLAVLYLENKNYGKAKEMMRRMMAFKKRSDFSLARQNTTLPQAIMGGEATLPEIR